MNKDKILTLLLLFFLFSNFSYARRLKEQDIFSWLNIDIAEDDVEREELLEASYRNGSPA